MSTRKESRPDTNIEVALRRVSSIYGSSKIEQAWAISSYVWILTSQKLAGTNLNQPVLVCADYLDFLSGIDIP